MGRITGDHKKGGGDIRRIRGDEEKGLDELRGKMKWIDEQGNGGKKKVEECVKFN